MKTFNYSMLTLELVKRLASGCTEDLEAAFTAFEYFLDENGYFEEDDMCGKGQREAYYGFMPDFREDWDKDNKLMDFFGTFLEECEKTAFDILLPLIRSGYGIFAHCPDYIKKFDYPSKGGESHA